MSAAISPTIADSRSGRHEYFVLMVRVGRSDQTELEVAETPGDNLSRIFLEFTKTPDDERIRSSLEQALTEPDAERHWVAEAANGWLSADPPDTAVVLARLRTELLRLQNAVVLQKSRIPFGEAGRVGELLLQRVDDSQLDPERVEADLHFFLVAAAALFSCARSACERLDIEEPEDPASLRAARNISQHIEEYNADEGRNQSVWRQHVQTWQLRSDAERVTWTWAGVVIDISALSEQAIATTSRVVSEIDSVVPRESSGNCLLVTDSGDHQTTDE